MTRRHLAIACVLPMMSLGSCGEGASEQAAGTTDEQAGVAVIEYTVRGVVSTLPDPPLRDLMVRHEEIPEFRETLTDDPPKGMPVMTMPFPLAEGVELIDVSPGDPVEIVFAVFYDRESGRLTDFETRRVTPLARDTVLDLPELASPDAGEGVEPGAE